MKIVNVGLVANRIDFIGGRSNEWREVKNKSIFPVEQARSTSLLDRYL